MVTKDFRSDNTLPASPEILEAMVRANAGSMTSYGGDAATERLRARCRELFETELAEIFPVVSGTAANGLGAALLTPPWGALFCHDEAHLHLEEFGAVEFFSGGAKVMPVAGAKGKLRGDDLAAAIDKARNDRVGIPSCVSLTNATEAGTVYTAHELRAVCEVARAAGLGVHLDGARFANAVAATGASPADLSWRAGVDVLSFGATKNGAMTADAIVVFGKETAQTLPIRIHRAGHRPSKSRFVAVQLEAYLTDDLWLRNARQANAMAARLAGAIGKGVEIVQPVEANIVFARFPPPLAAALQGDGYQFFDWPTFGADAYRLVTGYATTEEDVDGFGEAIRAYLRS